MKEYTHRLMEQKREPRNGLTKCSLNYPEEQKQFSGGRIIFSKIDARATGCSYTKQINSYINKNE